MVPSGLFSLVRSSWSRWGHLFSRVAIGSYVYLQLIHVNNMRAISKLNITKDYFSYNINIEAHFQLKSSNSVEPIIIHTRDLDVMGLSC